MLYLISVLFFVGYSTANFIQPRIYGGEPVASNTEFPFIVSIQKGNRHICGGSILNKHSIVTAAHCVFNEGGLRIMAGSNKLGATDHAQFRDVQLVIIHPDYEPRDASGHDSEEELSPNDIAVLRLAEPLKFCHSIKKIDLISEDQLDEAIENKETATIIGWGATDDAIVPRFLQKLDVDLWTRQECIDDIPQSCHPLFDPDKQLCTGPVETRSSFTGAGELDDGGSLTVDGYLAGVILHGKHEDDDQCHISTIYTKITIYASFLEDAIE